MLNATVYLAMIYCLKVPSFFVALQVDVTQLIEGHSSYLRMTKNPGAA